MKTFFEVMQIVIFLWLSYWFVIGLFGFGKAKKLANHAPENRFLLLIPANNEAAVISDILENLKQIDYPDHLYDICLIADNCQDNTAEIGRSKDVMVLEHFYLPGEKKGKPYAIRYAIETVDLNQYDAICVFDADNLVSRNYLEQMNNHLCAGEKIVQCYIDTKNPTDNFVTIAFDTSFRVMNRSWQLAKSRLGLSNVIGGTGFCVEMNVFREVGWTAKSLTEDLEFTMQALLRGVKTTWCHHAKVYDEKPTGFKDSCIQRLRWSRGHWDVCFKYTAPLLKRAFIKGDLSAFDSVLYLLNPGRIAAAFIMSSFFYIALVFGHTLYDTIIPMWVYTFMLLSNFMYIHISLKDAKHKVNTFKAYFYLNLISLSNIPLYFWSFLTFSKKVWVTTKHTKSSSLQQVEDLV
ncbi:putative glycosyl transferase [Paenibacillus sp. TCA20]|uniref:Glycosyltransferase family 2 protein n=1 Tax=Paenibacillus urinalis TaxID=521520 RepID=A0ABY7XHE0_9BACL|nr:MULTISPECIES: glycosyltransferase family 2 protein [Paenibacillus]WDI05207.1 glycosyltransferase family 2 protein [Paenibacillus urinalis]GAK41964.1 putative glycosyl transferase [Paenibacillus sp. TCA20]